MSLDILFHNLEWLVNVVFSLELETLYLYSRFHLSILSNGIYSRPSFRASSIMGIL